MLTHRVRPVAGLLIAFTAGLLALPACDKKKDGASTTDTSPPAQEYKGSKGGPPGGMPNPGTTNDPSLPAPPGAGPVSTADARTKTLSKNNLAQVGIAFHNAMDTTGTFPAGIADSTGKAGLSWRVALLPYLEQLNLYNQFKLNEPWNSEHNKKLISMMPKTYAPPGVDTKGYTYYRSFSGKDAFLPPGGTAQPGQLIPGLKFADLKDGTSNTLMMAEALEPVIWTKPEDLPFSPGKPPRLGGGVFEDGFAVVFCDGAPRFLPKTIDQATLSNLIQINDGQIVKLP